MLNFENLAESDNRSIQTLMRNVEPDMLMIALKGATEPVKDKFFANMSTRAAAMFQDEMARAELNYPDLFNQVSTDRPYKRLLANKASKISFDNKEIGSLIKDFYLTDSISRLSKTMAECSQIRKELRNGKTI